MHIPLHEELVVADLRLLLGEESIKEILEEPKLRSLLVVPLRLYGDIQGLIFYGQMQAQRNWTREDVLFGRHIASLIEQVLSNMNHALVQRKLRLHNEELELRVQERNKRISASYQALEQLSLTDPLTGLHNRRFLMQNIESDVAMVLRSYQNSQGTLPTKMQTEPDLVMYMVDLDFFKSVNDLYGHASGDMVLVQMRERLQKVFRESDYLVRWAERNSSSSLGVSVVHSQARRPSGFALQSPTKCSKSPMDVKFPKPVLSVLLHFPSSSRNPMRSLGRKS